MSAFNSSVTIYEGVPFAKDYAHTLYTESVQQQVEYFSQYAIKSYVQDLSHCRIGDPISVGVHIDTIANANYIKIQNGTYGNKNYFGFIDRMVYKNEQRTDIYYTVDVMQTYFHDTHFRECFVEREHSQTDEIGDNTVPENLELGDLIQYGSAKSDLNTFALKIFAASTINKDLSPVAGGMMNGVYSGTAILSFETPEELNDFIIHVTEQNKVDAILSIFMMPAVFKDMYEENKEFFIKCTKPNKHSNFISATENGLSYTPKNAKMQTYPYRRVVLSNNLGDTLDFKYEFFKPQDYNESGEFNAFKIFGSYEPNPQSLCFPIRYKGGSVGAPTPTTLKDMNVMHGLQINSYPQCSFNVDSYKAWLAQNWGATTLSAIGAVTSMISTSPLSGITGAMSLMVEQINQQAKPPNSHGAFNSSIIASNNALTFCAYDYGISSEYAKIIDEYFSMYGYACHRVKIPNINARQKYCYTKTVNCNMVGNAPSSVLAEINTIHNNGITYWKTNAPVGIYSDNPPV